MYSSGCVISSLPRLGLKVKGRDYRDTTLMIENQIEIEMSRDINNWAVYKGSFISSLPWGFIRIRDPWSAKKHVRVIHGIAGSAS